MALLRAHQLHLKRIGSVPAQEHAMVALAEIQNLRAKRSMHMTCKLTSTCSSTLYSVHYGPTHVRLQYTTGHVRIR